MAVNPKVPAAAVGGAGGVQIAVILQYYFKIPDSVAQAEAVLLTLIGGFIVGWLTSDRPHGAQQ